MKSSKNLIRKLSEEEMSNLPYKENPLLKKILDLEQEIFLMDLRKRCGDQDEYKFLNSRIKMNQKEQAIIWAQFVLEVDMELEGKL